jgi:hypothetical protein
MSSLISGFMETDDDSDLVCYGGSFVRCRLMDGLCRLYNSCETE